MKTKILLLTVVLIMLVGNLAYAEDGLLFRRDVSKTPEAETEKASIFMMDFYVPAQASTGLVGVVDNYQLLDGTDAVDYPDRSYAKPLMSVYIDDTGGESIVADPIRGGISFGHFDAYFGVSLDDGTSWKTTNLSRSADLSSFNLANGYAYPGDVHNVVHQVFGDNVMVAWVSKYCDGGTPLYSLSTETNLATYATYFEDLEVNYLKDAVYLYDLFGVAGAQGSVDYTLQGHPDIGEIPYSCVWTARGKLLAGDDPSTTEAEATYVMWTKPERLTSGTRDANLPAVDCAAGAGCILTWQEDPEGLRPGLGLGPGEGWSGAVAWQQTDIWYSHISQVDFDKVFAAEDTIDAISMADYALLTDTTMPKPYVPMAMPVRLTDNAMCKATNSDPYCYIDFDNIGAIDPLALPTAPTADSDFCATQLSWINPGGTTLNICVTEDNRLLNGRVASTRVRLNLKPYTPAAAVDLDGDGVVEKQAWVIMAAEETKALGDTAEDEYDDPIDIGKDVWYYSFDPFKTGADEFMVSQGGMLNQPGLCKLDGEEYCTNGVGQFYDIQLDDRGYEYYLTEIARRFALTTNSVAAADASTSGLSAMLIYKQGIINQGGPADIFLRRVLVPETFDPSVDNPYAFENMDCAEWEYADGSNPNYLQGVCLSPAINISGSTIVECTTGSGNAACAADFPVADDGSIPDEIEAFPKVTEWRQLPYQSSDAYTDLDDLTDLDDQSWENPYDVSKGHRGFLDGDYVMMMYAWSPNWKANSVGNDHYNLYVRRSFDGGATWTTTPGSLGGVGTTATENYCVGVSAEECTGTDFVYAAGALEQARNVSQLIGNKITILDPRYSPTGGMKLYSTIRTDWLEDNAGLLPAITSDDTLPYTDDEVRDPSKFFMIYETGDNTTVTEGEAVPLDLFYSRATVYGDVWELDPDYYDEMTGELLDYRWNWAEKDHEILSGEAAMLANPGGTFVYATWNQWEEEILPDGHELVFNSDMPFRRFLYAADLTAESMDLAPVASIIYVSTTQADYDDPDIVLVGGGRDIDRLGNEDDPAGSGIDNYRWWSDIQGHEFNERTWQFPPRGLIPGWHDFSFQVQDNEGNWSQPKTVRIWIGPRYTLYMPTITR